MRQRRIGALIASDVSTQTNFSVRDRNYGERTIWRMMWQKVAGMPSIFDILMRTGTLGSDAQRRLVRDEADLLFEPPMDGLSPLDWKSFDHAVAEGYAHAARQIEVHGLPPGLG
jgi:NTE family protein